MTLSRNQLFRHHYNLQYAHLQKQVAVYGVRGNIIAYKGNTTGERSRTVLRRLARETARTLARTAIVKD